MFRSFQIKQNEIDKLGPDIFYQLVPLELRQGIDAGESE